MGVPPKALDIAVTAAKEAGRLLLLHHRKPLRIKIKDNNPRNLVTNADTEADAAIRAVILGSFPCHTILSEESSHEGREYTWHVDPLDGTTNYSRGGDYFCTSIALAKGRDIILGVIANHLSGETFTAVKGEGAFCNGKKIRPLEIAGLGEAMVCVDSGYSIGRRMHTFELAKAIAGAKAVRMKGSGALSLCEIATGRVDAYLHMGSKAWDYAAGAIIIREAGGIVTDLHGREWLLDTSESVLAAGSKQVHRQFLSAIAKLVGQE